MRQAELKSSRALPRVPALAREAIDAAAQLATIGAEVGQAEVQTTGELSDLLSDARAKIAAAVDAMWRVARYSLPPLACSNRLADVAEAEQDGDAA
jgi:hypothetical protein